MAAIRSPNKDDNNYTIGVARIKNRGLPKWTSEANDQQNISGFIYMVIKSRDYVIQTYIFCKLSILLYSVQ